ncbi:MAG: proton-conducting transporter membrane subunit [Candidatus Altiarchaeia archaeon]
MALGSYIIYAMAALVATQLLRSNKPMNLVALSHALACIALAAYSLNIGPAHYFDGNFLIDALSMYEISITGTIFLFAIVYAGGHAERLIELGVMDKRNLKPYYLSLNCLLMFTVLSFASNNLALFWIFVELTTFFTAFLIAILNSKKNVDASLKYIFVTSTAMLFSFTGLILLFALSENATGKGTLNWDELLANAQAFPPVFLTAAFAFTFIGFAAKSGVAPFHTPLPHAYSKAPSAVSTIVSAVMLNLGMTGILRIYSIIKQTSAGPAASNLLIAFGVFSLFVATLSMLHQRNVKKLIAFSSTEHSGIMLIGIAVGTPIAIFWVLYHMLAHALIKAILFLSTGIIQRQYNTNNAGKIVNIFKMQPIAGTGLALGSAAILGMPPFILFLSKFSIFTQVAAYSLPLLFVMLLFLLIASAAFTNLLSEIFSRTEDVKMERYNPPKRMTAPIVALLIIAFVLGVYMPNDLYVFLTKVVSDLKF